MHRRESDGVDGDHREGVIKDGPGDRKIGRGEIIGRSSQRGMPARTKATTSARAIFAMAAYSVDITAGASIVLASVRTFRLW